MNRFNFRSIITLLRPHQWIKNLLVFAPLFFSNIFSLDLAILTFGAFVSFSFAASAGYCFNDLLDREADSLHPTKQKRPIASKEISVSQALLIMAILCCLAGLISWFLVNDFLLLVITLYLILQIAYSVYIKHVPILDLIVLSFQYIIRILAGVAATGILPSSWILVFTWLLAFMVVGGKRYLEHDLSTSKSNYTRPVLCTYSSIYLRHIMACFGSMALMCYLLWCNETVQVGRFSVLEVFPSALIVAFGVLRYLLLVFQKLFDEDPARGLLKDRPIMISIIIFVLYFGFIMYLR